jgi:uncharacterized protein YjbI with pentapeptide repeats
MPNLGLSDKIALIGLGVSIVVAAIPLILGNTMMGVAVFPASVLVLIAIRACFTNVRWWGHVEPWFQGRKALVIAAICVLSLSALGYLYTRPASPCTTDHYSSDWNTIQNASGQAVEAGRIQALEELSSCQQSLSGVKAEYAHLANLQLQRGTDLSGADFRGADLHGAKLPAVNLQGANLQGADLHGAMLGKVVLDGAHLENTNNQQTNLSQVHLEGASLAFAHIQGANLEGAFLTAQAVLYTANLQGADLQYAHLRSADLSNAHLEGAMLQNAQLQNVMLSGTHLDHAHLDGAILYDSPTQDAQLHVCAQFARTLGLQSAVLDSGERSFLRSCKPSLR